MANKKATMTDLRLLIREFIKGTSKRKISEKLNLSRTSVDVYIGRIDASGKLAEELLHSDDKTLSQVMVRDSGHRNTDNEKLEELTPLLEDYARQMQLRNMTYQLLFENYSQRVAHPYGYTQFMDGYTTDPSHMPPNHLAYMRSRECNAAYFLDKSRLIGPATHEVMEAVLKSPRFVQQSYKACHGILRLAAKFGNERLENACLRIGPVSSAKNTRLNALVIFDDFGLQPLDDNSRLALLQILEDCYEWKSVIITSQLPVAKWYDYIKGPTLADAIMDRLTANARRIELKGESLRRKSK